MQLINSIICVVVLTLSSIIEKIVVKDHHYIHLSIVRLVYMLLITCIILLVFFSKEFTVAKLQKSMLDYNIFLIALFTAIGLILYYWLLTKVDLHIASNVWILAILFTVIGASLLLKESISIVKLIGITITFAGLFILALATK
jgi:drug/metabolite transporter (DMT)-like permease